MADGLLSVADIARDRAWNPSTAWRWLRKLERVHGARLVRDGRALFIERTELARVIALLPKPIDSRVAREIRHLRERVTTLEERQNGLAHDVLEFRRIAAEWFRRGSPA